MWLRNRGQATACRGLPDVRHDCLARDGGAEVRSEPAAGADLPSRALADAIAGKVRKGYWVESQSDSEARLVMLGRKRWFGLFGGRLPERREILRLDDEGRPKVELMPQRRY
jgi:hypothetical protein